MLTHCSWARITAGLACVYACGLPLQHLQSDQHRQFVLDSSNYSVVDQLVAAMLPGFDLDPSQEEHNNMCVKNFRPTLLHCPVPLKQSHVMTKDFCTGMCLNG